ncbi:MAG: hypothetical protein IJA83_05455 [Clostridia bacterium]|nr:hypothetical protein [Clostridia bacterium]
MMKKHFALLALLLCMALPLTACSGPEVEEYYQTAQLYLGCGDYDYAAELFAQLGEYEDSADYALYATALQAMEDEEYALARANMEAVNPFKSSGRYLMYLDALAAEEDGDMAQALSLYEKLGTFMDAHLAAERLQIAIPEAAIKEGRALMGKGEYEKARELFLSLDGYGDSAKLADNCTAALNKAAYDAAEALFKAGDLSGAMAAFTAMGDTLGAAKRAEDCLAAIHAELDKQYAAVTLETAPALLEAYAAMEDETANARAAELTARFGKNLALVSMEKPCIALGAYPAAESGEEQPVLWRVLKKDGTTLTLLSEQVLDASAAAECITLSMTEAEQAAVMEAMLPSMAEVAALPDLSCTATAYALAQGADASYWLRDGLENGVHPIISAEGALTVPAEGATPGIRPVITLDLEKITFTDGSGTAEDPFCIK